jgi:hypothetical protein
MLILTSTSDLIRLVTSAAANSIDVHASYVDLSGTTVTPGRTNTKITTATTTTVVGSPAASTQRNLKSLYVTNNSSGTNCNVAVQHFDGTNAVELIEFVLLPGENLGYLEDGSWVHRDAAGAEYPPSGLGAYNGQTVPFMKSGTAADSVGYWYCTSKDAGYPGAWAPGTPGVNGRVTDGTASADFGCLPVPAAATGANFITELQMQASLNHSHLFFDCLWVNSDIVVTTTTAQTITTPTLPARDVNGETNGEGCMIAMLTTTANTNASAIANTTISYTNSKGVAGRTATLTAMAGSQIPSSPAIGTIVWFNLDAGDTGVKSIESITLGTTVANVMAQKVIGSPGIRLYNGSCILHCYLASTTTAAFCNGEVTIMEK